MSMNFSANQFEDAYNPQRLCSWQVPKQRFSQRPRWRRGATRAVADDRGYLLAPHRPPPRTAWEDYPGDISRQCAPEADAKDKWTAKEQGGARGGAKELSARSEVERGGEEQEQGSGQDEVQGDAPGEAAKHHETQGEVEERQQEAERDTGPESAAPFQSPSSMGHGDQSPGSVGTEEQQDSRSVANGDQGLRIVGHGNQGPRPPVAADYSPFNLAKRSAEENLRHQPLPDTVVDPNYQLMESQGAKHPGASLPMISRATAVSVRHKHPGPTHCTKSSIFRTVQPPTENPLSSLAPLGGKGDWGEAKTSKVHRPKVTDMDLAIGWDIYAPIKAGGKDHIVGSAPSVFNIVPPPSPPAGSCGMPGGCGTPPVGCGTPPVGCGTPPVGCGTPPVGCGTPPVGCRTPPGGCGTPPGGCRTPPRGCSMPPHNGIEKAPCSSKQTSPPHSKATSTATKSPPASQHSSKPPTPMTAQRSRGSWRRPPPPRKAWEEKENNSPNLTPPINQFLGNEVRQCFSSNNAPQVAKDSSRQRRSHSTPNLTRNSTMGSNGTFHKSCGACNENPKSNSPQKNSESSSYKMAFKAGKPNNSRPVTAHPAGGSASTMSEGAKVKVPKPRAPYARRSYSISTLAPPFSLWPGNHRRGAREYPEHWRLASVYQHAYKPIHSRKRPLLSTVYQ